MFWLSLTVKMPWCLLTKNSKIISKQWTSTKIFQFIAAQICFHIIITCSNSESANIKYPVKRDCGSSIINCSMCRHVSIENHITFPSRMKCQVNWNWYIETIKMGIGKTPYISYKTMSCYMTTHIKKSKIFHKSWWIFGYSRS